ncbi:hypothetical protein KEM48_004221 [Puccinia striiformis f. sp. tritici PST-130]|nr:hypothetical protein KEM48_004221 [Puccinia striiformis f. sp. tritici PST-130]
MSDSMRRTESKAEYGIARRTAADFLRKVKTCRPAPAPPVGANVASQKDDKRRFVLEWMATKLIRYGLRTSRHLGGTKGFLCRKFSTLRPGGEQGGQSKQFLRRAVTDPYGKTKSRARGETTYVARSAHKLIQLDKQFRIFPASPRSATRAAFRVLDLGAAPGGWSEVVLERLACLQHFQPQPVASVTTSPPGLSPPTPLSNGNRHLKSSVKYRHRLIACDLLPLHPSIAPKVSKNVDFHSIQGDFMDPRFELR